MKLVEEIEYSTLLKIGQIFLASLNDFATRLDASLNYMNYIALPIIMASKENKSYNPFASIIEKYVEFIVSHKMESNNYRFLPLGFSSDLCFESDNAIIHLDIKTANIENPSDFSGTIPLGANQTSYKGFLPLGKKDCGFYFSKGKEPFKVYPNLPVVYTCTSENGSLKKKITVTNAIMFIYPDYKKILDSVRGDYEEILSLIDGKLSTCIMEILSDNERNMLSIESINSYLERKNKNTNIKTKRILSENIMRAYYLHNLKDDIQSKFKLTNMEKNKLEAFVSKIDRVICDLRKKNIRPIAILAISIPNGMLSPLYDNDIKSGKSYGHSIRYHYKDGIFKTLSSKKKRVSRVIFLSYDKTYEIKLKRYFNPMYVIEFSQKEV